MTARQTRRLRALSREARTWHAQAMPGCTVSGCGAEAKGACHDCGAWVCGAHRASELLCAGCARRRRRTMHNAATCGHENTESLSESVNWCPDCGTRWAPTGEDINRTDALYLRKLAELYPDRFGGETA